jgi:MATE family multidrug resistance protein
MFVVLLVYVYKSSLFADYRKMEKGLSLNSLQLKEIYKIGIPSGLQYFFEIGAFTAANIMTGWLGTFQSAAHQIALTLAAVSYMVSMGISTAGSIRVGTAYGDEDIQATKRAGYSALYMISAFMVFSAIAFLLLNKVLPPLFNPQETVVSYASALLIIAALFQFSDGAQAVGLGILRGIKDVRYPTVVTLVAYWLVGLPAAYLFAFNLNMDVQGIWYGLTIGLTISAIFVTRRFVILVNRS